MNKNLHHISLAKFNKLNMKLKNKQNIKAWFHFTEPLLLYLAFTFCTFSVYLWRVVWSAPVPVQSFFTQSQNVLGIVCAEELKIVCFYMITFIFWSWLQARTQNEHVTSESLKCEKMSTTMVGRRRKVLILDGLRHS